MRLSFISTLLAGSGLVAAGPLPKDHEDSDHGLKAVIDKSASTWGVKTPQLQPFRWTRSNRTHSSNLSHSKRLKALP